MLETIILHESEVTHLCSFIFLHCELGSLSSVWGKVVLLVVRIVAQVLLSKAVYEEHIVIIVDGC